MSCKIEKIAKKPSEIEETMITSLTISIIGCYCASLWQCILRPKQNKETKQKNPA